MSDEQHLKDYMLKKITEILEEVHQYSGEGCPICCCQEYPVDQDGKRILFGESVEDAEEWHIDHHSDCLIPILDKYYIKIKESGLY